MIISVYCMSGAGNIFSVIDNRNTRFSIETLQKLTPLLCSESCSQSTEGCIVMNDGNANNDFIVDFFNPDGSYGAMCGNGARCAVRFAESLGIITKNDVVFTMANTQYSARFVGNEIVVNFPPPIDITAEKMVAVNDCVVQGGYVNVGSDHFIVEMPRDGFSDIDLENFARPLRYHDDFLPRGVNVNISTFHNMAILIRTYERGVEAETGACGTGAISTALYYALKYQIPSPIKLIPTSGQQLTVGFDRNDDTIFSNVYLQGSAEFLETVSVDVPV